jgi:hypothetical protein
MRIAPFDLPDLPRFIRQCDPQQPLDADDDRYVDLDDGTKVRGAGGASCIDEIEQTMLYSEPTSALCQLFTGFPGSGKTTELRRLKKRLETNERMPLHVLMVDFQDYRTDSTPLSIMETLRVLAFELDRAATRAEGGDPEAVGGYSKRFYDFLATTSFDLKGQSFAQLGPTLMFEPKGNPTFRQPIEAAVASRFHVFARDAAEVMAAAVVRIRDALSVQQVVVLVDALEKVSPLGEFADERAQLEASAQTLFVEHAARLRLPCHVVYTFPLWLRFRTAPLDALYDRPARILPMVKVSERDGTPYRPGYAKLTELVGKRLHLEMIFGAELDKTLHLLIAASGGYARDLIRMVREVLWSGGPFPADPAKIREIVEETAEGYIMTIRDAEADLMAEVARTHALPRDGDRLAMFGRLLQEYLVLAYRNGKQWYDLHPLAREAPIIKERLGTAPRQ